MKRSILVCTVVLATLAACAKRPESISASYISDIPYRGLTCEQISMEQQRLNSAYTAAAKQQENARSGDVVGVLLIGIPVSSLSGDNIAPEIARLKGESDALHRAAMTNGCAYPRSIETNSSSGDPRFGN